MLHDVLDAHLPRPTSLQIWQLIREFSNLRHCSSSVNMSAVPMFQIHEAAARGLQKEQRIIGVEVDVEDVATVWQGVGRLVQCSLAQNKGCRIPGFGSFAMHKGEPVFIMAGDFGRANGLKQKGGLGMMDNVPITALNFTQLGTDLGVSLPRAAVEKVVQRVLYVLGREVRGGKAVLVTLKGVCEMTVGQGELRCDFAPELTADLRQAASVAPPLRVIPALAGPLAAATAAAQVRTWLETHSTLVSRDNNTPP